MNENNEKLFGKSKYSLNGLYQNPETNILPIDETNNLPTDEANNLPTDDTNNLPPNETNIDETPRPPSEKSNREDENEDSTIKGVTKLFEVPQNLIPTSQTPTNDNINNSFEPHLPSEINQNNSPRKIPQNSDQSKDDDFESEPIRFSKSTDLKQHKVSPLPPNKRSQTARNPRLTRSKRRVNNALRDKVLKGDISDLSDSQCDDLFITFVDERKRTAQNCDFKESAKLTEAIDKLSEAKTRKKKLALQKEAQAEYQEMVAQYQKEIQDFDKETQTQVNELDIKHEELKEALKKQHEEETKQFYDKWTSSSKLRQYNHASSQLRNYRKQFKQLMLQCRFDEAEYINQLINKCETQERLVASETMQHDYSHSLEKLQQKQKNEIQFLDEKMKIQRSTYIRGREYLRLQFNNKKKRLDAKEAEVNDIDHLWSKQRLDRQNETSATKTVLFNRLVEKDFKNDLFADETTIKLPPLDLRGTKKGSIKSSRSSSSNFSANGA